MTVRNLITEDRILKLFDTALILKVIHGCTEIVGAVLVLTVPPVLVVKVAETVTAGELAEDSGSFIAHGILTAAQSFAIHPHIFIAAYLAVHGVLKVVLVIGIFARKRIAYPLFIVVLALFGLYEVYRGFVRHETVLYVLAAFDIMLLMLTVHEYRLRYPGHPLFSVNRKASFEEDGK